MAANGDSRPTFSDLKARGDRALLASSSIIKDVQDNLALSGRILRTVDSEAADRSAVLESSRDASNRRQRR
jgi:hypothetical protein